MKPKHTPGPWSVQDGSRDGGQTVSVLSRDERGDWVLSSVNLCMGKESEANARLIAAAPELLEALKKALENLPGDAQEEDEQGDAIRSAIIAIAKAEGEE